LKFVTTRGTTAIMNNNKNISLNRDIGQLGFAAIALNGVIGAGIFR